MKRFLLGMLVILSTISILSGCGKVKQITNPKENEVQTNSQKSAENKLAVQIAKEYVVKTYGEITKNQYFDAKREKDGTYTVQVYRDLGDHNEGIAWLNVNTKTKKVIDGVH